jgi:hypothetical protein
MLGHRLYILMGMQSTIVFKDDIENVELVHIAVNSFRT